MAIRKTLFLTIILFIPFFLGVGIVGYWYWTSRIEKKALLPNFGVVPGFSLTSERNQTITRNNLLGKVSIIDFIFTDCAGACPVMSMKMKDLQKVVRAEPAIQLVSVSVDPETDTPEVLKKYAEQHDALSGKWIFLTGRKDSIYTLTKDGFHLGLDIEGEGAIIHSQKFVLVDSRGEIRGYYDSEDEEAMKNLIRDALALSRRISA
ncbi:MAG: SCO family protein [Ignavibacteriae bacterium]|nr:SCO family protein [Ignavibacteria bacterium]MBI3363486.1 SCO family protein [Ignavibacteriota bacterium]